LVGWSSVSPSANTALPKMIRVAADELLGNKPDRPINSHDRDHNVDMTRITRVRRRPSMHWSSRNGRRTMVAVFVAKTYSIVRVETLPTSRVYAVKPASVLGVAHEGGHEG